MAPTTPPTICTSERARRGPIARTVASVSDTPTAAPKAASKIHTMYPKKYDRDNPMIAPFKRGKRNNPTLKNATAAIDESRASKTAFDATGAERRRSKSLFSKSTAIA